MNQSYRFEQFVLDARRHTLSRDGSPIFLTPKAFEVLLFLVQNSNRLVTKEELLPDMEYGGTPLSRAVINVNLAFQALGKK